MRCDAGRVRISTLVVLLALPGCYASHDRGVVLDVSCTSAPPACTRRASPCAALELVPAACDDTVWSCPEGTEPYTPPWTGDRCLPLLGEVERLDVVNEGPVPVPIGGRCAWIYHSMHDDIRLEATFAAPSCDMLELPMPVATPTGDFAWMTVQSSFEDATGRDRVLVRGWVGDLSAPHRVRVAGSGFGRIVDDAIVVTTTPWLFDETLPIGAAAVVDGGFLYLYGCPDDAYCLGSDAIVGRAPLDRIDDRSAWSVLGTDGWGAGTPVGVLPMGPHRADVVRDPRGGFLHVYVSGFGAAIEILHADRPEGPWSTGGPVVPCELPSDDPSAFCAAPVLHPELHDPTRPDELVVGYSITTSADDGWTLRMSRLESYWPRLVRVRR